ncbi:LOW QUALITY PROTEIN: 2-hydroxyacyl-CoA lyase 1-like [Chelonus insularis]|uniref:LOW QUALITY PROTEIN: 2-hydroxyacyl-CoA lyase 1-like n=1 Tax=Chelonus insularis TaxID=460826 RepID=UPI00158EB998|nr:LOW QUALITY PROTEIN: 2-hydroxyacyl-CoA lyase 1-like [Chelonus insularis]
MVVVKGKGSHCSFVVYEGSFALLFLIFLTFTEDELQMFINSTNLPFLPTPMGKGVISDLDPHCVSSARTTALLHADVILLLGARLNWMLHFGRPPRYQSDVKIIQVEICAEELHNSVTSEVAIQADTRKISDALQSKNFYFGQEEDWWTQLEKAGSENKMKLQQLSSDISVPLNYYTVFKHIQDVLPTDCIICSEGANTMDIGRSILLNLHPRHRLDAGTFGTMGVGLGFAIAAALHCKDFSPKKRVICVEGDSAFGFSAMEIETMFRYKLPIIIIIVNNNGIYGGFDKETFNQIQNQGPTIFTPPYSLCADVHYERMMELFDRKGYFCTTVDDIQNAVKSSLKVTDAPSLINILINPTAERKEQKFGWLTESKL